MIDNPSKESLTYCSTMAVLLIDYVIGKFVDAFEKLYCFNGIKMRIYQDILLLQWKLQSKLIVDDYLPKLP